MSGPAFLNVVGLSDNIAWLKQVPTASVDSCVCDPPYGLGEPPPIATVMMAWARGKDYRSEGTGFMGESWDAFVPNPSIWREVFRILKPGAWLLAFFGSRTYDLGSVAIRFAGFDITDSMQWLYGQGFPKGLDIAKAIDKEAGHWRGRAGKAVSENRSMAAPNYERTAKGEAVTDDAKRWAGWISALKPAFEPIVVARKPFEGTYVDNILTNGTGAFNIGACRIGTGGDKTDGGCKGTSALHGGGIKDRAPVDKTVGRYPANVVLAHDPRCVPKGTRRVKTGVAVQRHGGGQAIFGGLAGGENKLGARPDAGYAGTDGCEEVADWDCVEDCPVGMLDRQSGVSKSAGGRIGNKAGIGARGVYGSFTPDAVKGDPGYGDEGGAARFFYTAKAAAKEKWSYCRACKVVFQHTAEDAFEEHDAHKESVTSHSTQKPLDLMEYLVRLVTQPGGIVVDPFAGTGSTAVASKRCGFNFVTCDIGEDYVKIAEARLAAATIGNDAKIGASYFCPGCKAKGEIKLIEKSVVDRMKLDGRKVTCSKCYKRYSFEELTNA